MLSLEDMQMIVDQIKFRDWQFNLFNGGGHPYLKITFYDKDIRTDHLELQHCRKWQLSPHMVPSEIVRTAHKAVLAAMEHEADERFTYKGVRVFDPHTDLNWIAANKPPISERNPIV